MQPNDDTLFAMPILTLSGKDILMLACLAISTLVAQSQAVANTGREYWELEVRPLIASVCAPCHVGKRFAFASLIESDDTLTIEQSNQNYQQFLSLVSLDMPTKSRLLAKPLPESHIDGMQHGGGTQLQIGDSVYTKLLGWINREREDRCADCGMNSKGHFLAYVEQPSVFWALPRSPIRSDHGLRNQARIMLQPLIPGSLQPTGAPINFLNDQFCGADGRCDFGHLSVNHAGTQMTFECRLGAPGEDWVTEVSWNICIAEIGVDGYAINPRLLLPPEQRKSGRSVARTDPLGLYKSGKPLKGVYDKHFWTRARNDSTPAFSPDDQWIYFSSQGVDPSTGQDGTQTYHGSDHLNNIVAVKTDGTGLRTIYRNEGGVADYPLFRRNGNLVFRTWNLERMDRFLYTQSRANGMTEEPVFMGAVQGPNMWGKLTELSNGGVIGVTGRRFAEADNYVAFFGDHTLGIGDIDPNLRPVEILDKALFEQIAPFPNGFCKTPPEGENCKIERFYADPSYAPDGRAFIAFSPSPVHPSQGERMFLNFATGNTKKEKVRSLPEHTPSALGISLIDHRGHTTRVLDPREGYSYRYPVWVGKRSAPHIQPVVASSTSGNWSDLHIADVPLWFSFAIHKPNEQEKSQLYTRYLNRIASIRILAKVMDGNACLKDGIYYSNSVQGTLVDHPTHLGIVNSTGYERFHVPTSLGGDGFGDVRLAEDRSVKLRVPAHTLLLFQGIDAQGHVVVQRSRLLSLPPGQSVDTSVKAGQYRSQCSSCHHRVTPSDEFVALSETQKVSVVPLEFETTSSLNSPVDLTDPLVRREELTYRKAIQPILEGNCTDCHSVNHPGGPAGELSLDSSYSETANFPAGRWASESLLARKDYMNSIPLAQRVPGYNYSMTYSWVLRNDESAYRNHPAYSKSLAEHLPLGNLAPWEPGYQNLFARDTQGLRYLSGYTHTGFGRSYRLGGNSSDSWLIEILSARDLSRRKTDLSIDHSTILTDSQQRTIMAVIDVGFPYMATCTDKTIESGPNLGQPWGDPNVVDLGTDH